MGNSTLGNSSPGHSPYHTLSDTREGTAPLLVVYPTEGGVDSMHGYFAARATRLRLEQAQPTVVVGDEPRAEEFCTPVNLCEPLTLTSCGSGRWFDPGIYHS